MFSRLAHLRLDRQTREAKRPSVLVAAAVPEGVSRATARKRDGW